MKSIKDMTPEELRKLADEKEDELNSVIKEGILKHDIYHHGIERITPSQYLDWNFTKDEFDQFINNISNHMLKLMIPKETRFICYNDCGIEFWTDDINFGIEADNDWAEKHLENIKDLRIK